MTEFKPGDLTEELDQIVGDPDDPWMTPGDVALVVDCTKLPFPNGKGFHHYFKLLFKEKAYWVIEHPSLKLVKAAL